MEKNCEIYKYISFLVATHLLLGSFTFWLGWRISDFNGLSSNQIGVDPGEEKWENPLSDLSLPEVHAPIYLIQLAKYEAFVSQSLLDLSKNYTNILEDGLLKKIEDYLLEYQKEKTRASLNNDGSKDQATLIAQNPLLTLNMIWRFTYDLTVIFEELQKQPYIFRVRNGPGKELVTNLNAFLKWPNKWTLQEALIAFFRVQMVYDLEARDLAAGKLFGVDTGSRMSIQQIIELGKYARAKEMYTLAVPWLELACQRLESLENPTNGNLEIELSVIQTYLLETMEEHDRKWPDRDEWPYFYNNLLLDPNKKPVEDRLPIRKLNLAGSRSRIMTTDYDYERSYWSLCSGENHQTEYEKSQLFCWYDTKTDPALTIFPIKKELMSIAPFIVQMYEAISDSDIKNLISITSEELKRSRVVEEGASDGISGHLLTPLSEIRTSVEAFVFDNEKLSEKLEKFVEIVTGLNVLPESSSENFLVASYSFGGHYECHTDSFLDVTTLGPNGNRIATFMFYLETTEEGGLTAFPQAGVATRPIKGSAVFWYNVKTSGEADLKTHHCACPVVLGHKTISTKWIRHYDQFQVRPCGLTENSMYSPMPEF